MTDNKARKADIRAYMAAHDVNYATAARALDDATSTRPKKSILCADLHRKLVRQFRKSGWPVEDAGWEDWAWAQYVGPQVSIHLTRDTYFGNSEVDPDDPTEADLTTPPSIGVMFLFASHHGTGPAADMGVAGDQPVSVIVEKVQNLVKTTRTTALNTTPNTVQCGYCIDRYPREHLIDAITEANNEPTTPLTGGGRTNSALCPACIFEPDVLANRDPYQFALNYDLMSASEPVIPAAWVGPAALTAITFTTLNSPVAEIWEQEFSSPFITTAPHWTNPNQLWVWLPPTEVRPDCWKHFGPGASLGDLTDTLNNAHPNLFTELTDNAYAMPEYDPDDPECTEDPYNLEQAATNGTTTNGTPRAARIIPELWPAIIAYAVGFTTQTIERSSHQSPWHVMGDSLEESVLEDYVTSAQLVDGPELGWDGWELRIALTMSRDLANTIFTTEQ